MLVRKENGGKTQNCAAFATKAPDLVFNFIKPLGALSCSPKQNALANSFMHQGLIGTLLLLLLLLS